MNRTKVLCSLLAVAALAVPLVTTGCKTPISQANIAKVDAIREMITPVAASAVRRALVNSPDHAVLIAPYIAAVAGVFCNITVNTNFSPDYVIQEVEKLADPKLATLAGGFALDLKNVVVNSYKLLYNDRFRAEVSPDTWMLKVSQFICESLNTGLADAGYAGGVKKTSASIRRDLYDRIAKVNDGIY